MSSPSFLWVCLRFWMSFLEKALELSVFIPVAHLDITPPLAPDENTCPQRHLFYFSSCENQFPASFFSPPLRSAFRSFLFLSFEPTSPTVTPPPFPIVSLVFANLTLVDNLH